MSPVPFQGVLQSLQQSHDGKFLEALAELEKTPRNDLTPEELLFSPPNPLQLSRKFSTPSLFLSQPSFNDLLPANPQLQLPRNVQLAISTLDKVVMESLLLAKPKEPSSYQYQKIEEKLPRLKNSQKSSPTKIPAHLYSFNLDSNAIASIMSSSRSKQANELNLAFCHDWRFANDSQSQPVETKMPTESKSSTTSQVSSSPSKTSRSDIPTASKSTPGRASKRQASCSSTNKFSSEKGNLITPSSSHSTLQTVKIMLNTDQDNMTDGSDGESTASNNTTRKLPNTHKKGQPSMLASSSQQSSSTSSSIRRQRQRERSRASRTRSVSARSSRISTSRAPRLRKFARGRKRAPKH